MITKFAIRGALFLIHETLKKIAPATKNRLDDKIVESFSEIRKVIKRAL